MGDPAKANEQLDWTHATSLSEMVADLVRAGIDVVQRDKDRRGRHG
ncbi:hypothetical protein LCL97_10295 [Seohaeicola saemankumensis]|nr:hypothetical protein [Seohaeicola saemankumensis]MCA0871219.1 hypothetical protein [Seohaeicola saemankumensis]